ncbi:uncharacterized protein LOC144876722 isoform X1 [Branchiostoma floridae x Branchiostoma japonicum]
MKRAVGTEVSLVLMLAVSVSLIAAAPREVPSSRAGHLRSKRSLSSVDDSVAVEQEHLSTTPDHRVVRRALHDALPGDLQGALQAAAAEDAPEDVKDKRFLPAIAGLAGKLLSSGAVAKAGGLVGKAGELGANLAGVQDLIGVLGDVKNMVPDFMAQGAEREAEVEAEVEKEVARETVEKVLGEVGSRGERDEDSTKGEHGKRKARIRYRNRGDDENNEGGDDGEHEVKADIEFDPEKGMVASNMFAPPGMRMKLDVQEDPKKQTEPDQSSQPMSFSYPMGMGPALVNGCFGTGYKAGDPCFNKKDLIPACFNMMEGCGYIGVGFDGRGDYSSKSRKKSVVQRNCKNLATYHDEDVPDNMNVHGIFDTEVASFVFESRESYRHYIQMKAGMSFSSFVFKAAVDTVYGSKTSVSKQQFMSLIQCNVVRYEIFLDEISPDTLSLAFLRDFLSLPFNFVMGKAKLQKFILRYGTHFIKSAKFGGSFRLFKTQEASKVSSFQEFSVKSEASLNAIFANAKAEFGLESSSGSSYDIHFFILCPCGDFQSSKTSGTHVTVEGGDQEVASIVADFYSTSFKDTFAEWLKSIPKFPKPIEMFMGTMSELLDMNYKLLFPFDIKDAADGCFSKTLKTEEGTGRKYYEVSKLVNSSQGVAETVNEKRYCEFTSAEKFEEAMDKKRLALERAIAVYMEEGPVPTTDFHLEGGKPGCVTKALKIHGGASGVTHPTWLELINGDTYKVIFDIPENINSDITMATEVFLVFAENRWNCHAPGTELHMYNSHANGGSGDTGNTKVSCFGFVMTYDEEMGKFTVTPEDQAASVQALGKLPRDYKYMRVARAEYISPLEHAKAKGGALAGILEAPCSVKWSNSYQISPADTGGKCLYFLAASAGDIFAVFSAIPRDKTTWYHLQISYQGVALYKGMKLVKYEAAKSARSLGDPKLFRPYFICLEEDMEKKTTYITYGIASEASEKGLVYMVYLDDSPPLGIQFYSFGSGEKDVEVMDVRVIEGGGNRHVVCTGGTVLKDGLCVEDCHPECIGCIPSFPGSKLDTECRACKHFSMYSRCVSECPADMELTDNGKRCVCKGLVVELKEGTTQCASSCPAKYDLATDGKTCKYDGYECGYRPDGTYKSCDVKGNKPCCSRSRECGNTPDHCACVGCVDSRCLIGKGETYRGNIAVTKSGKTCQRWGSQYPHKHKLKAGTKPEDALYNNYCRNPSGADTIWCLTTDSEKRWDYCDKRACDGPKWRNDGKCGKNFPAPGGLPAQCDPNSDKPCCSSEGTCGGTDAHCTCEGCVDYRPKWRDDGKCGEYFPAPGASPGQCDPISDKPCCSSAGTCGNTDAHCMCSGCVDYDPGYECGYTRRGTYKSCDANGDKPCCSRNRLCGNTPDHCACVGCVDSRCLIGKGETYRGNIAVTKSGKTCQRWGSQYPHKHTLKAGTKPEDALYNNYCRNPGGDDTIWCYTTDPKKRWEYCDKRACDGPKWRIDGKCGKNFPAPGGLPAQCDPKSNKPCCSSEGTCGGTDAHCTCEGCVDYRPKWRDDGKCGKNFPAPGASPGECNPNSDKPCCSSEGTCGNTDAHCYCSGCVNYFKGIPWRNDGKCGEKFPAPAVSPGQCNPKSDKPCCSSWGTCGNTYAHCKCSGCVDYGPKKWRSDGRCGRRDYPAPGANPGQCNPESSGPCCSASFWCGGSHAHCKCSGCVNYGAKTSLSWFDHYDKKGLPGHNDEMIARISVEECAKRCLAGTSIVPAGSCLSFDYDATYKKCMLSKVSKDTPGANLADSDPPERYDYYNRRATPKR